MNSIVSNVPAIVATAPSEADRLLNEVRAAWDKFAKSKSQANRDKLLLGRKLAALKKHDGNGWMVKVQNVGVSWDTANRCIKYVEFYETFVKHLAEVYPDSDPSNFPQEAIIKGGKDKAEIERGWHPNGGKKHNPHTPDPKPKANDKPKGGTDTATGEGKKAADAPQPPPGNEANNGDQGGSTGPQPAPANPASDKPTRPTRNRLDSVKELGFDVVIKKPGKDGYTKVKVTVPTLIVPEGWNEAEEVANAPA